jgi:hypothetical protein
MSPKLPTLFSFVWKFNKRAAIRRLHATRRSAYSTMSDAWRGCLHDHALG